MFSSTSIARTLLFLFHVITSMLTEPEVEPKVVKSAELSRGLGDHIAWKTFEEGMMESKNSNKLLVLVIHKTWCGACKTFKDQFATSDEIKDLSLNFVMVNTEDDEEPSDPKFTPDGGYIPRVLFLEPNGEVMLDVYNESGNQNYRYYYYDAQAVIGSMKKALLLWKSKMTPSGEL